MNYKLIIIVFILFLIPNFAIAELSRVNVSVDILPYEYPDTFVVGDRFYYIINLTNPTNETIYSDFSVSIYNPVNVESTRNYTRIIESGKSIDIVAIGEDIDEKAIFPFDIAGVYKIKIKSTKPIQFYKLISYVGSNQTGYIRTPLESIFYFDVMPSWQYHLWKEEEKINKQSLDLSQKMYDITTNIDNVTKEMNQATQEMNIVTKQMNQATQDMNGATTKMLIVALISLTVAAFSLVVVLKKK